MRNIPRRTIAEIIQLHKREGSRQRELFVEGPEDRRFYANVLSGLGLNSVQVLDIDTVEICAADVLALGLQVGCKGRVVCLASALNGKVPVSAVACVADADTEHVSRSSPNLALLLLTDFTSIELYAYTEYVFKKLDVSLQLPLTWAKVSQEMQSVLVDAFLMRVVCAQIGLPGEFPDDFSAFCAFTKQDSSPLFRFNDYAARVLSATHGRPAAVAFMQAEVAKLKRSLPADPRMCMHGHDFKSLFGWYVRKHSNVSIDKNTVSTLLLALIDCERLACEPLFVELSSRFGSPT